MKNEKIEQIKKSVAYQPDLAAQDYWLASIDFQRLTKDELDVLWLAVVGSCHALCMQSKVLRQMEEKYPIKAKK